MMVYLLKLLFIVSISISSFSFLSGEITLDSAQNAYLAGEFKLAIDRYNKLIEIAPLQEKSSLKVALAKAYLKDQEHEKAFDTFLAALQDVTVSPYEPPSPEELIHYNNALSIYLNHSALDLLKAAKQIVSEFNPVVKSHPEYTQLAFIVAAAQANLGSFEHFFDLFYNSFVHHPHHYLSYKTKAILHIKLFEKAKTPENRLKHRQGILENAMLASEQFNKDTGLFSLMLLFAEDKDKERFITMILNRILKEDIIIPRSGVLFFTQTALEHHQKELAQQFVDRAKQWYPQSRQVEASQALLH